MSEVIYQGATSPEAMSITIQAAGSEDLSTVTSASLWAKNNAGETSEWTATISSQSQRSITLHHTFADGEVDTIGLMKIVAYLNTPDGTIKSKAVSLLVIDPFQ